MATLLRHALTALVTLVLGIICLQVFWSPPEAQRVDSESIAGLQRAVENLESRVETLEREQNSQASQLLRLARPPSAPRIPAEPLTDQNLNKGEHPSTAAVEDLEEQQQEHVKSLVRDELAIAREDDWQHRLSRVRSRVERKVDAFAKTASLSDEQATSLLDTLAGERVEIMEMRRAIRQEGGDFDSLTQKLEALRARTDQRVGDLLDAEQLSAYTLQRERDQERFNRRFGR